MRRYEVIIIGGGHAGAEAAWAAANLLPNGGAVALVTPKPETIGVMSCNPAIGGLAKGQLVREIDALGGLMGLAADATGIMFKVLNRSRGPAVRGPRCQSDKHAYAHAVRTMIESRPEIEIVRGMVGRIVTEPLPGSSRRRAVGVELAPADGGPTETIRARAVVLTTGTFMRGLMHTGESRTPGGRVGEHAANALSHDLESLGFELGRLKTGTPPRLDRTTIDWDDLEPQLGDDEPEAFSELSPAGWAVGGIELNRFPRLEQVACRQTRTSPQAHETIRANLHRAPMFSGQIESRGPRYCPSIEDKVVRFADRESHGVFLEPESLTGDSVYCNGISTSLPTDVQDVIVRTMPGCERARILQYGYAVEYDSVRPHQIRATCETKPVEGLYLAGQINGTSGYEEAAAQGLLAGANAAAVALDGAKLVLPREGSYLGTLIDDLCTKDLREPYRMLTSRSEYRLVLRSDNADQRLTPIGRECGLIDDERWGMFTEKMRAVEDELERLKNTRVKSDSEVVQAILNAGAGGAKKPSRQSFTLEELLRRPEVDTAMLDGFGLGGGLTRWDAEAVEVKVKYEGFIKRQEGQVAKVAGKMNKKIPEGIDYGAITTLRMEAREKLAKMTPRTVGQASRIGGVTPADISSLLVHLEVGNRQKGVGKDARRAAKADRKAAVEAAVKERSETQSQSVAPPR